MATVLFVIAQDVFRDEEYTQPKETLEHRGAEIVTASVEAGDCRGKFGARAVADIALRDAVAADYDAVVLVGGAGASVFFDDPYAHAFVKAMNDAEKVVAAICIAPSTLARAGLLAGVAATSFPSQEGDLVAHGAHFTGAPVQVDGRVITANGPEPAYLFGDAVADALGLPPA